MQVIIIVSFEKRLAFDSQQAVSSGRHAVSMGTKAVEPLAQALKTDNWCLRGNAAWALGTTGEPMSRGAVDRRAQGTKVPEVRVPASIALVNIGERLGPLKGPYTKNPLGFYRLVTCIIDRIDSKHITV